MSAALLSETAFVDLLRREGKARYHDRHPFHVAMHTGRLSPDELRAWVANRYYYQTRIPKKDALLVSRSDDPSFRRTWLRRIVDHDGEREGEGGIAQWERLGIGVGLDVQEMRAFAHVAPGVRFACDAYLTLVRERPFVAAVASSLTEFFSPDIMAERVKAWEQHYPWVHTDTLAYFRGRVSRARQDSHEALAWVTAHATTRELQEACVDALVEKTTILWGLLDAVAATQRAPRSS